MPGLTFSNELISRDEGLHTDFACQLYTQLRHGLPAARVYQIVREAVELEVQQQYHGLLQQLSGATLPGDPHA